MGGNYIGVMPGASSAADAILPNQCNGVSITGGANQNLIGTNGLKRDTGDFDVVFALASLQQLVVARQRSYDPLWSHSLS